MKDKWIDNIRDILRNGITEEHKLFARRYARRAKYHINRTMKGLDNETQETREMAQLFFRMLEHELKLNDRTDPPTKEEVRAAIEQLKDVGRFSLFVTAVILPGGVISLVGLELLARKFGIENFTLVPSSFREKKDKQSHQPNRLS
ncbi:MAG: hypothetical protein AMS27_02410 [Bacteroides sp. SM23_62_1]|nr:MAG: hypothetical protein AMS27_02410 [Bacteroides sp. SM23_62_1]